MTTLEFDTARLRIRRFTIEDWPAFQALAKDYNTSDGGKYEGKWPATEADCRSSVAYMSTSDKHSACCLRDNGRLIGMLVLNGVDGNRQMDFGYVFHRDYQDGDHDVEAFEAAIGRLFSEDAISSVVVRWAPEWTAQFKTPMLLGFVPVENAKGEMQLTKEQWNPSRKPDR